MGSHTRRPKALRILLGLPAALLLVVFAIAADWGGGHPSLSALLVFWGLYPTLTLYLSRALLGFEFPSSTVMLLGILEYALVGVGIATLIAKLQGWAARGRAAVVALLIYISAQFTAHLLLNTQSVNLWEPLAIGRIRVLQRGRDEWSHCATLWSVRLRGGETRWCRSVVQEARQMSIRLPHDDA